VRRRSRLRRRPVWKECGEDIGETGYPKNGLRKDVGGIGVLARGTGTGRESDKCGRFSDGRRGFCNVSSMSRSVPPYSDDSRLENGQKHDVENTLREGSKCEILQQLLLRRKKYPGKRCCRKDTAIKSRSGFVGL